MVRIYKSEMLLRALLAYYVSSRFGDRQGTNRKIADEAQASPQLQNPQIVIAGVAKNIEPRIIRTIVPKLHRLGKQLRQPYHILVYENNSPSESRLAWAEALASKQSTFLFSDV